MARIWVFPASRFGLNFILPSQERPFRFFCAGRFLSVVFPERALFLCSERQRAKCRLQSRALPDCPCRRCGQQAAVCLPEPTSRPPRCTYQRLRPSWRALSGHSNAVCPTGLCVFASAPSLPLAKYRQHADSHHLKISILQRVATSIIQLALQRRWKLGIVAASLARVSLRRRFYADYHFQMFVYM